MDHYCTVRDSSFKTHCTQLCRSRASGPCCHREVCRPSAVIPSVRNIPQSGRGADTVAELLEPLYDVLRQYVLMPGKVHADDIPVPVGSRAVVKTERTGCGSTSVMTVMPGRRCPRRSGSRTVRTGKVSIHRIIWPVTAVCFRPILTVVTGRYTNPAE